LNKDKEIILSEIEEIKKILDQKFTELDNINKLIEMKDIEIDAIKSNFNHELNKINYKKKNYEENLNDYNEQYNKYENMKKVYDQDEDNFNNRIQDYKNNIINLDSQIIEMKNSLNTLISDLSRKDILLKKENEISVKIYLNKMKLNKIFQSKDQFNSEIQNLDVNIRKLESEIITMNMRIPALEEEKKGYINKKQFKDAGRVTNELSALTKSKNTNLEIIQENNEKIDNLKIEIENVYYFNQV